MRSQSSRDPVEIPADPSLLSIKEIKDLLSKLEIRFDGCTEKSELLDLLQKRKDTPRRDSTPTPGTPKADRSAQRAATRASEEGFAPAPSTMRIKILSFGAAGCGKSCLIKRHCEGRFVQKYITTIGVDYGVKPAQVLGQNVKVNFFDTSGGPEFKEIRIEFYDNAGGAMLVYDVTNRDSFAELETWLDEAKANHCPVSRQHRGSTAALPVGILCANKTDLPRRQISRADGERFAAEHGLLYYETSAATGENVNEVFSKLFEEVVRQHLETRKKHKISSGGGG